MAFLVVLILGGALKVCVAAVNVDKQHITLQSTQVCAAAVNMDKYQYAGFRWVSYRHINANKETALHYIITSQVLGGRVIGASTPIKKLHYITSSQVVSCIVIWLQQLIHRTFNHGQRCRWDSLIVMQVMNSRWRGFRSYRLEAAGNESKGSN
ncbi:hypothetical protein V6N13_107520 [Hibiscus sabdariffa]